MTVSDEAPKGVVPDSDLVRQTATDAEQDPRTAGQTHLNAQRVLRQDVQGAGASGHPVGAEHTHRRRSAAPRVVSER